MTDPRRRTYSSPNGNIHYTARFGSLEESPGLPSPPCQPRRQRPHSIHITRLPAGFIQVDLRSRLSPKPPKRPFKLSIDLRKLASRESAKRALGSVFPSFSHSTPTSSSSSSSLSPTPTPTDTTAPSSAVPSVAQNLDPTRTPSSERVQPRPRPLSYTPGSSSTIFTRRQEARRSVLIDPAMSRPSLMDISGELSRDSVGSIRPVIDAANDENEKPVAVGNGVACFIVLAEPVIYLTGHNHGSHPEAPATNSSALLRGKLRLNVTKSAKIKMKFWCD